MACFFGVLKKVMYTVHVGTLKAASLLATFLSLLCELPSKIRLMNTCACTMPSCWEDWTSKCHPWLRQRDSSCRRGCSITVSGVARGCNNGSCTWAIHHPIKKISGIVNCFMHLSNTSSNKENFRYCQLLHHLSACKPYSRNSKPSNRFKMWWLEDETHGSNIHTFLEEKKTFYLPNSLNVKICIQKNGCC